MNLIQEPSLKKFYATGVWSYIYSRQKVLTFYSTITYAFHFTVQNIASQPVKEGIISRSFIADKAVNSVNVKNYNALEIKTARMDASRIHINKRHIWQNS